MAFFSKQRAVVVYDYRIFVVVSQIFSKFRLMRSNLKYITKAERAKFS